MRPMADPNAGLLGYVVTQQEAVLHPYRIAHDHILDVGDSIEQIVSDRKPQYELIHEVQLQVQRLIEEKESLIKAVKAGHQEEAIDYVEQGRGRETMILIRQRMNKFKRLDRGLILYTLPKIENE